MPPSPGDGSEPVQLSSGELCPLSQLVVLTFLLPWEAYRPAQLAGLSTVQAIRSGDSIQA